MKQSSLHFNTQTTLLTSAAKSFAMKSLAEQVTAFMQWRSETDGREFTPTALAEAVARHQYDKPEEKRCKRQNIEQLLSKELQTPQYLVALAKAMGTTAEVLKAGRFVPGLTNALSVDRISVGDFASIARRETPFDAELGAVDMGAAPTPKPVPVVGMARLGDNGFYEEISSIPGAGDGYVMGYYTTDPEAYCLQVRGDSMFPAIKNGWFIVVEPHTRLAQGEYVVLKLHNGKKMVKELLYERSDSLTVVSVNGGIQQTIMREDLLDAQAVGTILPPSKWKPV